MRLVFESDGKLHSGIQSLVAFGQAAQGTVVHNDDTGMRVLMLQRDPKGEGTGVFIRGIVSVGEGHKIALYFTGSRHAGENLAEVLK